MSIKTKIVVWLTDKKIQSRKRNRSVCNLENARTAGVLWDCDDQTAYKSLVLKLKENNIKTVGFCFSERPISIKGEAVFSKQDFNWLGLPKSEEVLDFINTEFDLLIDISLSETNEAQGVRALSLAKFKTGWSAAEPDYFDLQIDISQRKEPSFLAEQIVHYLSELNKKENK